jgi:alkanesulfonate monooxygenase SsuD/methylene tetrahydromethanopterin reductase-like flavin-dependent oxidoreductase (luciferase family)
MLGVAGELADGVFLMGPERRQNFADKIARVRAAAATAGRNPADVKIALTVTGVFSDDVPGLVDSFKTLAIHYMHRTRYLHEYPEEFLPVFQKVRDLNASVPYPDGGAVYGQELVTEEMVKYMLIVGTRDEVRARLEELKTLDVDEITFQLNYPTANQIVELGQLIEDLR